MYYNYMGRYAYNFASKNTQHIKLYQISRSISKVGLQLFRCDCIEKKNDKNRIMFFNI